MRAARGSAANSARTAGGWLPGPVARRRAAACAVRVPIGYMRTWAPTQASSVRPPVRVEARHRPRSPPRGAVSVGGLGVPVWVQAWVIDCAHGRFPPFVLSPAAARVSALQVPG